MKLIIERTDQIFNQDEIRPGCLFYARHKTWENGRAGFVACVTDKEIEVQYYPGIRNVTNHYRITAVEAAARWSQDLKFVGEILMKGENTGDAGGADL